MKIRVEARLADIQEDFLSRIAVSAQEIFDENHKHVLGSLLICNERVDDMVAYHGVQRQMHDSLFAQNEEAIKLHNEVKKIFKEESESFFADRLKWKTDVQ